jgi:FAD/FMN-containing dehydrogenase
MPGRAATVRTMSRLDRRTFLLGSAAAGAALTAGCGSPPAAPQRGVARGPVPRTLRDAVRGPVFTPGRPGFTAASHVYNPRFDDVRPLAVARPLDADDVRDAIRFTVAAGMPVRARSGGHSYAGYSTLRDGVVLDLRGLDAIALDTRAATATVGSGAQLIDVYTRLARAGLTIPAGSCPSVGVAGVTLGGGFGLAGRHLGLTADNLLAARLVTADGELRSVSEHSDPDLFWALWGGGGGNFGVVTEFTFKVHPLPPRAAYFEVAWPWSSASDAIAAWQSWAPHATDRLTSILHVNAGRSPSITANGQYLGPAAALPGLLRTLLGVPGARLRGQTELPYLQLQLLLAGCEGRSVAYCHTSPRGALPRQAFTAKSDYVSAPLPHAGRAAMVAAAEAPGSGALLCDSYGGAINRIAPDATAFVHRDQLFCIQYYGDGSSPAWTDQAWAKMRPYVSGQAYQNYIDPSLRNWQRAYYGRGLERLEAVRRTVDPHHYFNFPQAIGR